MRHFATFSSLVALTLITNSCGPAKVTAGGIASQATENQWTLNPTPNNLDHAGLIMAINKKGIQTVIPAADLELPLDTGIIKVAQVANTKDVDLGLLGKFLSNSPNDTIVHAAIYDTMKADAKFSVDSGVIMRMKGDLAGAFEAKRPVIERNIKFLDLTQSKFYLILETVSSSRINITVDQTRKSGADILASINNWLNINPAIHRNTHVKDSLVYQDNGNPLTVLYKLRIININIHKGDQNVTVSLGDTLRRATIPYNTK